MATIKICDKCKAQSTDTYIRPFRWMGLMDDRNYKHTILIKVDLCGVCESKVRDAIMKSIGLTMRPLADDDCPHYTMKWRVETGSYVCEDCGKDMGNEVGN